MSKWPQVLMTAAALSLPAPALAQMLDSGGRPAGFERRVSAGVTIPLGASRSASGTPRLELRATGERFDPALDRRDRAVARLDTPRRESRIGLTLESRPQLIVDGRALPPDQDKLGLSTLGWVAIGVVTVAVVGGLLFIDALNDASD